MTAIDFLVIPVTILSGHFIANRVVSTNKVYHDRQLLIKLFYYHLAFSLLFAAYVTVFGGDSTGYWKFPRFYRTSWFDLHEPGTPFVYFLTYPFSQVLGVSFWGGTVLFSLFGFGGVVSIYLTLRKLLPVNPSLFGYKLFPLVLFLPNMHFWSGGVGKDSVIFFAIATFVFCLTDLRRNVVLLTICFYLAFFIRPHIALVMVVALAIALFLSSSNVTTFWRIAFLALSVVAFIAIAPTVFKFVGVEENIENYEDISNIRSKNLSRSKVGSKIQIGTMSMPMKIFTFFYRPLFFDGINAFGLIVSFENLFYLVLTLSVFKRGILRRLFFLPMPLKACGIMAFATAFFMSGSMGNLGIIIRQKNMVMFMVVLVSMYLMAQVQKSSKKAERGRRRIVMPPALAQKH